MDSAGLVGWWVEPARRLQWTEGRWAGGRVDGRAGRSTVGRISGHAEWASESMRWRAVGWQANGRADERADGWAKGWLIDNGAGAALIRFYRPSLTQVQHQTHKFG